MRVTIQLEKEMETLLIPLYGRAQMTRAGVCNDPYAKQVIDSIDYDFSKLKMQKKLQVFMAIRSGILDDFTNIFLNTCQNTEILSLGSGLDARYLRMNGYAKWTDLDFPQVIQLREKLLPQKDHHFSIPSSVTDWAWLDHYSPKCEHLLVIAEGLFMYLHAADVYNLLNRLAKKCKDVTFIFDVYSTLTVKKIGLQRSLKETGASIFWGIDSPKELEMHTSLTYDKTLYLTIQTYTERLDRFYKMMFRFAGRFSAAKEAHRIMVFRSHFC